MRLGYRLAVWVLAVYGVTLLLGGAALLVRLLPWLLDPQISWEIIGQFMRSVALVTLETAGVVALLLGAALAGVSWQDRGEGVALLVSGISPWFLASRGWPTLVFVALVSWTSGEIARRDLASPEVMTTWMDAARHGCDGRVRRVSEVPGTGMGWLCEAGEEPWLVLSPGGGSVLQTRQIQPNPEGKGWVFQDMIWSLRGPPEVELRVKTAFLSGLVWPWQGDHPRRWLVLSALLGAWLLGACLLATGEGRRWIAVALGGVGIGSLLTLQAECDGGRIAVEWLALQPLLAVLPGGVWWVQWRLRFLLG